MIAAHGGLRFTARRARLVNYLLPRHTLFVVPNRIASVLREADVIHLHIRREAGDDTANLEFSAGTAALAASIVRYLPAGQTVESERPSRPGAPQRRWRRTALWMSLSGLVVVGIFAALLVPKSEEEPDVPRSREISLSRAELRAAEVRTARLRQQFRVDLHDLMEGKVTQANFALRLNRDLIPQWRREREELSSRFDRVSTHLNVLDLLRRSADL